jgi:hypothetical protein
LTIEYSCPNAKIGKWVRLSQSRRQSNRRLQTLINARSGSSTSKAKAPSCASPNIAFAILGEVEVGIVLSQSRFCIDPKLV